jgi:hypothetical protein
VVVRNGYVVLRSPGGFRFCFVSEPLSLRPGATRWPHGHESIVDQVCLDIPPAQFERECAFWSTLTSWPLRHSTHRPEFAHLVRPAGMPLRLLLQRLEDPQQEGVTAHLDLATDDRDTEALRHAHLGAQRAERQPGDHWTVMLDPTGGRYCITDRDPESGLLD